MTTETASTSKPLLRSSLLQRQDTSNKFGILQDGVENVETLVKGKKNKSNSKPPPICIVGATSFSKAINIINKCCVVKNYLLKYMSVGMKILLGNIADYDAVTKQLIKEDIRFYTHELKSEKISKFVLTGLQKMETNDISRELEEQGLMPCSVRYLSAKQARFNEEAIYLVGFPSDSIKLVNLQLKVKAINHTIIKWKQHVPKRSGPTQCTKCQMFGHGGNNCHLKLRCRKCSGEHLANECSNTASKCSNCNGTHPADAKECPKRTSFIEMRMKLSAANNINSKVKSVARRTQHVENLVVNQQNFPSLKPNATNSPSWAQHSNVVKKNIPGSSNWLLAEKVTYNSVTSPQLPQQKSTPNGDLFTTQEIIEVTKAVFSGLKQCKTKEDQLEVVFSIAAKYIYGSVP